MVRCPPQKKRPSTPTRAAYREAARGSLAAFPCASAPVGALQVSEQSAWPRTRRRTHRANCWPLRRVRGHHRQSRGQRNRLRLSARQDSIHRARSRDRRSAVSQDHFYGTKRPCIDTNYYETYNLPHVHLVDLRKDPLASITETGIDTASRSFRIRCHRLRHGLRCHDRCDCRRRYPGSRRASLKRPGQADR